MPLMFALMIVFVILFPIEVYAYVGPGLGLGAIGAILGILFAVFLGLFSLIWYPVKRLFTKKRQDEGSVKM